MRKMITKLIAVGLILILVACEEEEVQPTLKFDKYLEWVVTTEDINRFPASVKDHIYVNVLLYWRGDEEYTDQVIEKYNGFAIPLRENDVKIINNVAKGKIDNLADGFEVNLTVTTKDLPLGGVYGIAGLKFTATIKQNGKIVKEYSGVKFSQNSDGTPNSYANGGPGCFHCTVEYRVK